MKNVKLILNDGNHTSFKAFYLYAFILLGTMLFSSNSFAQTPNIITYQGKLTMQGTDVSGETTITARLYANVEGTEKVWEGIYKTYVTDGIFALPLGAGRYPLPAPSKLDRQLWVGISVDGVELRPLTQLTSTPYALNVADKSITKAKLSDELVGALATQDPQTNGNGISYWDENGNYSLNIDTSDYLGTKDASWVMIKVGADSSTNGGYGVVMQYLPNSTSANILGGHNSNRIGNGFGNVLSGGGFYLHPNKIGTNASSSYAFLGGGEDNILDGGHAVLVGGENDTVVGNNSFLGGGRENSVGNPTNASHESAILGGSNNKTLGDNSAILGGRNLTLSGDNVVGFNAGSAITFSGSNAMFLNDVDIHISNNSSTAKELVFHEASGNGGQTTTIKAQLQAADIDYLLPAAQGNANTFLRNDGTGDLSWQAITLSNDWTLLGNSGTTSVDDGGNNFLGTIDDKAFEIHVNRSGDSSQGRRRVIRYEPNDVSPNIIGGFNGNDISSGKVGSVIAGGGKFDEENAIHADFGFIGGGTHNDLHGTHSVIGGGNLNSGIGDFSVIGGGFKNVTSSKPLQTIGGGLNNSIGGYASFIGGGGGEFNDDTTDTDTDTLDFNLADAAWVAITGGRGNHARGVYGFIGGGRRNLIEKGVESDTSDFGFNTISGGEQNHIKWPDQYGESDIDTSVGNIPMNPHHSFIGGGKDNSVETQFSVIGGGDSNKIFGAEDTLNRTVNHYSFIGGGKNNQITIDLDEDIIADSSLFGAVIVGGTNNLASEIGVFIGGGDSNQALEEFAFVGGGRKNLAQNKFSTVVAGDSNIAGTQASFFTTVVAGQRNEVQADHSAIVGGKQNKVIFDNTNSFIGGGNGNLIGSDTSGQNGSGDFGVIVGGKSNRLRGQNSSIGGGEDNLITKAGSSATIPGGNNLQAQSFAQTVVGVSNAFQGQSAITSFRGQAGDSAARISRIHDRLFIVGNGYRRLADDTVTRENAFEVTNNGYAVVYGNLSSRGPDGIPLVNSANPSLFTNQPNTMPVSNKRPEPALYGGVHQDNQIIAWGDVPVGQVGQLTTPNSSFGVDSIRCGGPGIYTVTLRNAPSSTDPNQNTGLTQASITATPSYEFTATPPAKPLSIIATRIQNNQFRIYTYRDTARAFESFMFKVVGRR